jgi:hypothetical protein
LSTLISILFQALEMPVAEFARLPIQQGLGSDMAFQKHKNGKTKANVR